MLRSPLPRLAALVAAFVCLPLALWAASPLVGEGAQTPESLQRGIDARKAKERSLQSSAQKLAGLEAALSRDITVLQGRLGAVQADLTAAETKLGTTQVDLRGERARSQRLVARLAHGRRLLARRLREQYTASDPDLVTIVLSAQNLPDLLEQTEFLRRIQRSDQRIVSDVRDARDASRAQTRRLASLEVRQRDAVLAVRRRQAALQTMNAALASRQAALAQAKAARLAALHATRAGRLKAQGELKHLLAEREKAATSSAGPGGPWSIPWAIVQCESGGQNLPPNSAGASGYYQFMPATWRGLGGSTPNAYQASKAEQDRLAATLWAGGSGADNWDCAALVAA